MNADEIETQLRAAKDKSNTTEVMALLQTGDHASGWQLIREIASDSNAYDRYWDPVHGSAVAYKQGERLFGFVNGIYWETWDTVPGNVQAMRIRPESGEWWLYCYTDPRDGTRAEWKRPVAPVS